MKYTRLAISRTAPDAIQDWLEVELESRGIDAIVYARYILSVLLDEDDGIENNAALNNNVTSNGPNEYQNNNNGSNKYSSSNGKTQLLKKQKNKVLHKRYQNCGREESGADSWDFDNGFTNDQERKSAVIACLKSASEQVSTF